MIFLVYGVGLIKLLAGVSIAVAWHRLILLGEQPRLSGTNLATISLWRYVGIALAIYVIATLPAVVILLLSGDSFVFASLFPSSLSLHSGCKRRSPRRLRRSVFLVDTCVPRRLSRGYGGHASPEHLASSARSRGFGADVQRNVVPYARKYLAHVLGTCSLHAARDASSADRCVVSGWVCPALSFLSEYLPEHTQTNSLSSL